MRDYQVKKIKVDIGVQDEPLVKKIVARERNAEVEIVSSIDKEIRKACLEDNKQLLFLTSFPGSFIKACPGTGQGYLCCGYTVINQLIGCPLDCTYCILQDYLGGAPLVLYVNLDELERQLDRFLKKYNQSFFRMGSGELADSLALDYLAELSQFFVCYFKKQKNVVFEFKTKTDEVDRILSFTAAENIIVSWSLNPKAIVDSQEYHTASLKRRLHAARRVQEKGFRIGIHFDPIIFYPGWEAGYEKLIDCFFSYIDPERILWVSLGALRFPASLKNVIQQRFSATEIIYEEMVPGFDGKLRYLKPLRVKMFKKIYSLLQDRAPHIFYYLCMESPDVWNKVMGFSPSSSLHLRQIFNEHCQSVLGVQNYKSRCLKMK